jgi:hypothetical protein
MNHGSLSSCVSVFFIVGKNCYKYKKGLGNAHPARSQISNYATSFVNNQNVNLLEDNTGTIKKTEELIDALKVVDL